MDLFKSKDSLVYTVFQNSQDCIDTITDRQTDRQLDRQTDTQGERERERP